MTILSDELESDQTKLAAAGARLKKQQELLDAYERGHITIGEVTFLHSNNLIQKMKEAFAELRQEIIELENGIGN